MTKLNNNTMNPLIKWRNQTKQALTKHTQPESPTQLMELNWTNTQSNHMNYPANQDVNT
jgi:hypothetical protein